MKKAYPTIGDIDPWTMRKTEGTSSLCEVLQQINTHETKGKPHKRRSQQKGIRHIDQDYSSTVLLPPCGSVRDHLLRRTQTTTTQSRLLSIATGTSPSTTSREISTHSKESTKEKGNTPKESRMTTKGCNRSPSYNRGKVKESTRDAENRKRKEQRTTYTTATINVFRRLDEEKAE
eukprot:6007585-Amphidinium_carterae.1